MIFEVLPDRRVYVWAHPGQPALPGMGSDGVLLDESDLLELLDEVRGQWWTEGQQ